MMIKLLERIGADVEMVDCLFAVWCNKPERHPVRPADRPLLASYHLFCLGDVPMRRGFTLIELLVVIVIILIVSALVLPVVIPATRHRQVSEAARVLQGALVGARDQALKDNAPSGIRLLPDPAFPLVYLPNGQLDPNQPLVSNRIIPIGNAPDYNEGRVSQWQGDLPALVAALPYPGPGTSANPSPTYGQTGCLMVYESVLDTNGLINAPTGWFWNIRIGDKIQLNNAGPWYTVVGPMNVTPQQGNSELFVNVGPAGTKSPFLDPNGSGAFPEFLLLVNGIDDNKNGWKDEGWDGVDNDGKNGKDDIGEWETEKWSG